MRLSVVVVFSLHLTILLLLGKIVSYERENLTLTAGHSDRQSNNVLQSSSEIPAVLSYCLMEVNNVTQCLGIKPKAIEMTPISRTLNVVIYAAPSRKKQATKKQKDNSY